MLDSVSRVPASIEAITCPALFLAAPGSGQGKTTVTAALARYYRDQGKVVRVFKTGPDYLDPQILAQASGQPVEQLDIWMAGDAYCQRKLYAAAQVAELILIEGAMGLFDGEPSSADLAVRFGIPIALVMDVRGMAQTAAAVVAGLTHFKAGVTIVGLIANNCASTRHAQLIKDALAENCALLATLKRDSAFALPERHLGLVQASEVHDELEQRFHAGVEGLLAGGLAQGGLSKKLTAVTFHPMPSVATGKPLQNIRLGIAKDGAFSFIYTANLCLLEEMGAKICFFSPLEDSVLPDVDALWLPGGYPELHAQKLSANSKMKTAIGEFFAANKPILAECGGLLYCLEALTDLADRTYTMLGLLPGYGAMRGKRGCQGMQTARLPEGEIRAHAHHRSRSYATPEPISFARRQRHPAPGEALYRSRGLTACYLHLFFPSNPAAIGRLFSGAITPAYATASINHVAGE